MCLGHIIWFIQTKLTENIKSMSDTCTKEPVPAAAGQEAKCSWTHTERQTSVHAAFTGPWRTCRLHLVDSNPQPVAVLTTAPQSCYSGAFGYCNCV